MSYFIGLNSIGNNLVLNGKVVGRSNMTYESLNASIKERNNKSIVKTDLEIHIDYLFSESERLKGSDPGAGLTVILMCM